VARRRVGDDLPWEDLAVLPYDRCLRLMAPTGGTRYQTLCDQTAAGEDSTDLFDEPSASSDGQLAFLRGRSRPGAVAPDWLGLEVGVLRITADGTQSALHPVHAPERAVHNRVSHIGG
jgi:hypothetical protein